MKHIQHDAATDICYTQPCQARLLASSRARTPAQLELAQRIRYAAYVSAGWLDPNASEMFADEFDSLPNSETHLLAYHGRAIGSMRTHVFTGEPGWDDVPARHVFGDALFKHTGGETFVEMSRFAIHPEFKVMPREAQLALMSSAVYAADKYNCRYIVAAVRTTHVPYYRRMGFVLKEQSRPYPGLKFDTALIVMDWAYARPRLLKHHFFHVGFAFVANG